MFLKKKFVNNFQDLLDSANQEKLLDLYWLFSHSLVYVLINGVIKILSYQKLYFQCCNISLVLLCCLATWRIKPGEDTEGKYWHVCCIFLYPLSLVSGKSFGDGKGRDWDNEELHGVADDEDHCLVPSALLKPLGYHSWSLIFRVLCPTGQMSYLPAP